MKIMIIGAGGVGGYIAGRLAYEFPNEITLIARGNQLEAIKKNGLTIIEDNNQGYSVHPALCTDEPEQAGLQDVIFVCTKSYGLDAAIEQIKPCIGPDTLLLPLLNGISARRVIRSHTKSGVALDGCIYIFSQIDAPGVIRKVGSVCKVFMGIAPEETNTKALETMRMLCDMLCAGGIDTKISGEVVTMLWQKWILMISNAQAAAYFNKPIGEVREDPEKFKFVLDLLEEALAVAKLENIELPLDVREQIKTTIFSLSYESTPSLARDLNTPGKATELDIFCGELIRLAKKHKIDAPNNQKILNRFADRV
ncbi:ketopantoate reductase family protein [Eubacteriales bacterium OttesenSCG-928-K08]|nr:ketopantoate reductase family protein [Eubacteriales bacterium OttesenSCG-928-K08]